jgi:hypothetical protein
MEDKERKELEARISELEGRVRSLTDINEWLNGQIERYSRIIRIIKETTDFTEKPKL